MKSIIVVDKTDNWTFDIPDIEVVTAHRYLTDEEFITARNLRVFNLCSSYRYQSTGYYVSLLATARNHRPLPSVETIQDMKQQAIIKNADTELGDLIQRSLSQIKSDTFSLSIYFGENLAKHHSRLAAKLFTFFETPFSKAEFTRTKRWTLTNISPISLAEIPKNHHEFVIDATRQYFMKPRRTTKRQHGRYDLAILYDPESKTSPSNQQAIKKFTKAAEALGMDVEIITRDDYGRIAEFDALFIRETTEVNHYTYRMARRAAAEHLVVIDDPESIVRCINKVFHAELFRRQHISAPKTLILVKKGFSAEKVAEQLGIPCVLKQPDGTFSQGVKKAHSLEELKEKATEMFERSEIIIAQEFMQTEYDWRIGILDRKPLYACKYYMSRGHWQIINWNEKGKHHEGDDEAIPLDKVPPDVMAMALKATNLIGDGLYGVDLKVKDGKPYIIEINDNPNLDAGVEDKLIGDSLYTDIMKVFLERLERKRSA